MKVRVVMVPTILTETAGNGEDLEGKIRGDNLAMVNSSFSKHFTDAKPLNIPVS